MNYVILIGIALYFIATALRDGAMGWDFNGNSMSFRIDDGDSSLQVKGDGGIELEPDGSGIASLDRRRSFDVRLRQDGVDRRVLFTNEEGTVERQFFVDGDEQAWGPDADRFVAEVMPVVLRETAINADERIAWLIANRGQQGLLDEIELIRSDFAQRVYTVRFAQTAEIAAPDFERLMKTTADNMSSDFDARTTLIQVFDAQMPQGPSLGSLLAAGETISSDFDVRLLLTHVGPSMPSTPEGVTAYLDLARTISSDFDMRLALQPLLTRADAPDDLLARALEVAGAEISSDFDLRTVLVDRSDTLARAYTAAANSIGSDFDHRLALTALAEHAELTPTGWQHLLESARNIGSDFDTATLLAGVAASLPRDDTVMAAYRQTLDTIGSDFDRRRAEAAIEAPRR